MNQLKRFTSKSFFMKTAKNPRGWGVLALIFISLYFLASFMSPEKTSLEFLEFKVKDNAEASNIEIMVWGEKTFSQELVVVLEKDKRYLVTRYFSAEEKEKTQLLGKDVAQIQPVTTSQYLHFTYLKDVWFYLSLVSVVMALVNMYFRQANLRALGGRQPEVAGQRQLQAATEAVAEQGEAPGVGRLQHRPGGER